MVLRVVLVLFPSLLLYHHNTTVRYGGIYAPAVIVIGVAIVAVVYQPSLNRFDFIPVPIGK